MTAPGPLTLEDLERLEADWKATGIRPDADACLAMLAALRSVMAERDALRALCDRVREARKTAPLLHTFHCARGPTEECACGIGELRAAIEALGPGGGK